MSNERMLQRKWTSPATVLRVWIPAAYTVFVVSTLISAGFFYSGRQVRFEDALISVLQSRCGNPRGYLVASIGAAVSGGLLLPAATLWGIRM